VDKLTCKAGHFYDNKNYPQFQGKFALKNIFIHRIQKAQKKDGGLYPQLFDNGVVLRYNFSIIATWIS